MVSGVARSFRPLPREPDMGAGAEGHVVAAQGCQFTDPQAGLDVGDSRAWSRRPSQVVGSGAASRASTSTSVRREMIRRSNRLGGMASTRWMRAACRDDAARVAEEGVHRGQAGVPGAHVVGPAGFEVPEERGDEAGVQVLDLKLGGDLADPRFGEAEQQSEGVAIGGHGVRAGAALGDEPVGEERLERWSRGRHGCASAAFSSATTRTIPCGGRQSPRSCFEVLELREQVAALAAEVESLKGLGAPPSITHARPGAKPVDRPGGRPPPPAFRPTVL